jgi:transposase
MATAGKAEVVLAGAGGNRQYRSKRERRQIVEETLQPGASVAVIARQHGVNANQVFYWRKLYREGRLDGAPVAVPLMPVRIAEVVGGEQPSAKLCGGVIVVEMGRSRIRIEGAVDAENLRLILERLGKWFRLPAGMNIWIAAGITDLRRGFTGLSAVAQTVLEQDPYAGHVFVFRGRRGDLIKLLWWDGDGLCLFAKRLERGRFIWPQAEQGAVSLSRAQLSMLLEGIDWRRPIRTSEPSVAV